MLILADPRVVDDGLPQPGKNPVSQRGTLPAACRIGIYLASSIEILSIGGEKKERLVFARKPDTAWNIFCIGLIGEDGINSSPSSSTTEKWASLLPAT